MPDSRGGESEDQSFGKPNGISPAVTVHVEIAQASRVRSDSTNVRRNPQATRDTRTCLEQNRRRPAPERFRGRGTGFRVSCLDHACKDQRAVFVSDRQEKGDASAGRTAIAPIWKVVFFHRERIQSITLASFRAAVSIAGSRRL